MSRITKSLLVYVLLWLAAGLLAAWKNEDLGGHVFAYGGIAALVIATIYGLAQLTRALTGLERKEIKRTLRTVFGWSVSAVVFIGVIGWAATLWQSYTANRTAVVRQVFLRGANSEHAPEIYVNDGTVWMLEDSSDNVKMIAGDEVRYTHMGAPATYWPDGTPTSDSPDKCGLKDVTTGYYSWADRLSAPFTHTSCPSK